jgi:MIP family channel proteins
VRKYLAEFTAVFTIVFLAAAAIVADQQLAVREIRDSFGPLGVILAYGLAVTVAMAALGRVSGAHLNPAVSLALYIARRLSLNEMLRYVGAQFLGGIVAAFLVQRVFPSAAVNAVGVGTPALAPGVSLMQGGLIEVLLTFFLVLVVWSVLVDRKGPPALAPVAVGLTVVVCGLAGAPFTGAAMNPARWLGPALAARQFVNWPVWLLGPIVGALLASAAYESLFMSADGTDEVAETPVVAEIEEIVIVEVPSDGAAPAAPDET